MQKSLFVISDLHLGGEPGFQMCSPAGRQRLGAFIDYVATQRECPRDVHLVLNGDIVDFLAEKEFSSFTNDNEAARAKLCRIIENTREFWDKLRQFAATGARLTLMLGNHDVELSFPGPRRLLMETIAGERVEFIYDNQAFVEEAVLIEHGNRYDKWNVVSHDGLRAIRSAMSRKENPFEYLGPPGSQLVKSVMNPIKEKYPFVDLLKPENTGMLPILAVLEPQAIRNVPKLAALAARTAEPRFDESGIPLDHQNIAGMGTGYGEHDKSLALAYRLAGMGNMGNISAVGDLKGLLESLKEAVTDTAKQAVRIAKTSALLEAFQSFAKDHRQSFDVGHEDGIYLEPANAAAARGFQVVIYGHTHFVKRVALKTAGASYLNTGTWADLMKLPEAVLGGNTEAARKQLELFLVDLENNNLDRWRCQVPTFARIDFEDGVRRSADVYFFEDDGSVTPVSPGRLTRLDRGHMA